MKRLAVLAALLCGTLAGFAHAAVPKGWFIAGTTPRNYEAGVEQGAAYLRSRQKVDSGFGTLMQTIGAQAYRGKRIRLSGYLRSMDAGSGQLWLRVDGPKPPPLAFDNMQDRALTGTQARKRYDIVLDVPQEAVDIAFGFLLNSQGQVWADGLKLEVVDRSVPLTQNKPPLPLAPVNMDFSD